MNYGNDSNDDKNNTTSYIKYGSITNSNNDNNNESNNNSSNNNSSNISSNKR